MIENKLKKHIFDLMLKYIDKDIDVDLINDFKQKMEKILNENDLDLEFDIYSLKDRVIISPKNKLYYLALKQILQ